MEDLQKLERGFFDIIILDIVGIAHDLDAENEGAGLLSHLKTVNPSQVVIAYSGQSHEPSRIPFFNLADQFVPKPTNALSWKETLDDLITNKLTAAHYWQALKSVLINSGVTESRIRKLEKKLIKSARKGGADPGEITTSVLGNVDNAATVISIIAKMLSIASA